MNNKYKNNWRIATVIFLSLYALGIYKCFNPDKNNYVKNPPPKYYDQRELQILP